MAQNFCLKAFIFLTCQASRKIGLYVHVNVVLPLYIYILDIVYDFDVF